MQSVIWYDIFVNCNCVATRWQQYSTVHYSTVQYSTVEYSTVHIYTQTVHRTTQLIWEECGPCAVFVSYTVAFVLQLRKKHGKTSVRLAQWRTQEFCSGGVNKFSGGQRTDRTGIWGW